MNKVIMPFAAMCAIFIVSCGTSSYYQMYKAVPAERLAIKDDRVTLSLIHI